MSACLMCGCARATARFHGSDRLPPANRRNLTEVA